MGQKVHPLGFRLGITQDWDAHWFGEGKEFSNQLVEDIKIREYIAKRLPDAGIAKIVIDRASDKLSITIHTSRPGVVIGRKGAEVEELRKELVELIKKKDLNINVQEIRIPELAATLVAESIIQRILQRVSHRRVMKRTVDTVLKMGARGIKVMCKGRLGGAEIARKEWYRKGRVPLQTLRANIDYACRTAFTKYGTTGVKVWIYKGDILKPEEEEEIL